jgi:hypothetical protein
MSSLKDELGGHDESTARAALYYLARYIKQAPYFTKYGKNVFDEEGHSTPTDEVKSLTSRMIHYIERREGKLAVDFDDEKVMAILDEITDLESAMGPVIGPDEVQRVENFVNTIQAPPLVK